MDIITKGDYVMVLPVTGHRAGYAKVIGGYPGTHLIVNFVYKVNETGVHLEDRDYQFQPSFCKKVAFKEVEDAFF